MTTDTTRHMAADCLTRDCDSWKGIALRLGILAFVALLLGSLAYAGSAPVSAQQYDDPVVVTTEVNANTDKEGYENRIEMRHVENGTEIWNNTNYGGMSSVVTDDYVFVTNWQTDQLLKLDATTGQVVAQTDVSHLHDQTEDETNDYSNTIDWDPTRNRVYFLTPWNDTSPRTTGLAAYDTDLNQQEFVELSDIAYSQVRYNPDVDKVEVSNEAASSSSERDGLQQRDPEGLGNKTAILSNTAVYDFANYGDRNALITGTEVRLYNSSWTLIDSITRDFSSTLSGVSFSEEGQVIYYTTFGDAPAQSGGGLSKVTVTNDQLTQQWTITGGGETMPTTDKETDSIVTPAGFHNSSDGSLEWSTGGAYKVRMYEKPLVGQNVTTSPSEDLFLDVNEFMRHNSSQPYKVVDYDRPVGQRDVTDEATTESDDPTLVAVHESNDTLTSTSNTSRNDRTTITAELNGRTVSQNVTVANTTVDNLDILPGWWRLNASLSDWTIIWIFAATMGAIGGTRFATAWAGIGAFVMTMTAGWIMGDVPTGLALATAIAGIFLGLNLAANIDTSVG